MFSVPKATRGRSFDVGSWGALLAAVVLCGCPGDGTPIRTPDRGVDQGYVASDIGAPRLDTGGGGPDTGVPADSAPPQGDVNPGLCSPAGVATNCDPVAQTGCAAGVCYMIAGKGKACVCPQGTTPAGGACNTTAECASGFGCAGDTPPGSCRRFCSATNNTCAGNETCKAITAFPSVGLCIPN